MKAHYRMAAIFFWTVTWLGAFSCDVDDVAVYKVTLRMLWSEDTFPKDYPVNAQWSQSFGQSHNRTHALYHIGEVASPSVRHFTQTGSIEELVDEGEEEPKVYDQFVAPAVEDGVGETENVVFVDGEHNLVSVICRLIPSPDWFIGVDSLNLCLESGWVDQITLDLEPLDAGAVNGVTFNREIKWETDPAEPVEKITTTDPKFSSFQYSMKQLPPIAKIEFIRIKEFTRNEINNLVRKELFSEMKENGSHKTFANIKSRKVYGHAEFTTKNYVDQLKDLEEEPLGTPKPDVPDNYVEVVTRAPTTTTTTEESMFSEKLKNMDQVVLAVAKGHKLGLKKHLPRHFRSRLHHAVNKKHSRDCILSEWSKWSDCSIRCGMGESTRVRFIVQEKKGEGRECPHPLVERKPCKGVCRGDGDVYDW